MGTAQPSPWTSNWLGPRTAQADLVGGVPAVKVNDLQELPVMPEQQARRVQVPAHAWQASARHADGGARRARQAVPQRSTQHCQNS